MEDRKFIQSILDKIGEFGDGLLEFETRDIERLCNLAMGKDYSCGCGYNGKFISNKLHDSIKCPECNTVYCNV